MADRVFEDRVGLWVIDPTKLPDRLPAIQAFAGGLIRDLFLPRSCVPADIARVRAAGLAAHLWVSVDGLRADELAARTLADVDRLGPRGVELNLELDSDPPLLAYVDLVVGLIRARRGGLRLRLNLGAWKAFALPVRRLETDPALYACMQNYLGNMDELLSAADVASNLLDYGCPRAKLTICYAAACRVLGSSERVRALPDLSRLRRGVVFHDDLMADAGLL